MIRYPADEIDSGVFRNSKLARVSVKRVVVITMECWTLMLMTLLKSELLLSISSPSFAFHWKLKECVQHQFKMKWKMYPMHLPIGSEIYRKIWYKLHTSPDSSRWPNILILSELLFSLPSLLAVLSNCSHC